MQSLLLPTPWLPDSRFGQHRVDFNPGRTPTHVRPYSTAVKSSLRAVDSPSLMSGAVPADDVTEGTRGTQLAQGTTSDIVTSGLSNPPSTSTSLPTSRPAEGPQVSEPRQQLPASNVTKAGESTTPGSSGSGGPQAQPAPASIHPSSPKNTGRALPPRSSRRPKSHVASACVNCKRKHLGCDSARPCRRCVVSGKSASCVDVTHKKRGRPPLKAEETPPSRFTLTDRFIGSRQPYPATVTRSLPPSKPSREIRPITDLQYSRQSEYPRNFAGPLSDPYQSQWLPYSPTPGRQGQQPYSSPVSLPSSSVTYSLQTYATSPGTSYTSAEQTSFPPHRQHGTRPPPAVAPPTVTSQQYHQPYHSSISMYAQSSEYATSPGQQRSVPTRELPEPYHEPSLRLPPILPSWSAQSSPRAPTHRRAGSYTYPPIYPGILSPSRDQSQRQAQLLESPRIRLTRSPSHADLPSPYPTISQPPESSPSENRLHRYTFQQQAAERPEPPLASRFGDSGQQSERRERGEDDGDGDQSQRPSKRRRMAVDDIVND